MSTSHLQRARRASRHGARRLFLAGWARSAGQNARNTAQRTSTGPPARAQRSREARVRQASGTLRRMPLGELTVTDGPPAGSWIEPLLGGEFGAVTLQVPAAYEAYVRICHPAHDTAGRPVTWALVAEACGRAPHAVMQWHAIVGSPDSLNFKGSLWHGSPPDRGNLAPEQLETLCRALAAHTSDPAHCFFGLWAGWGWVTQGSDVFFLRRPGSPPGPASEHRPSPLSAQELSRPRLELPHREYLILTGPLRAAAQLGNHQGPGGCDPQSPNLMWPSDRAWFVASEIDFDSTLLGGTRKLCQAVLDEPGLDAWPVEPHDSLAYDADKINRTAATP